MENVIGFLFWSGVVYYLYIKFIGGTKKNVEVEDPFVYKNEISRFIPKSDYLREIEAKEIANSVKTHRGLEGLQNKIDALGDKMDDYHFNEKELMYEKTEEKQQIIEMALDYAYGNPYRYYYEVEPDIDTPLVEIKMIGKTISVQKYHELDEELRKNYNHISLEEAEDVEEANELVKDNFLMEEVDFKDLVKYRKLIESDETEIEKEKKFNNLISKSEYLMDELGLDMHEDGSLYDQYKYIQIVNQKIKKLYPLPYASFFVDNGYEEIGNIITMSDDEIRGMYGIGPKSLFEIRGYLDEIKALKETNLGSGAKF